MGSGEQPSEEEMRAAYEAEVKRIRVEHVLLDQVVSLINLGMRRTGLAPGTEDERDVGQVRLAIESVRVLLPLLEQSAAPQAGQIREALSQLQLAFVKLGGAPEAPSAGPGQPAAATGRRAAASSSPGAPAQARPAPDPAEPGDGGPAQRSGRLWIPGQ